MKWRIPRFEREFATVPRSRGEYSSSTRESGFGDFNDRLVDPGGVVRSKAFGITARFLPPYSCLRPRPWEHHADPRADQTEVLCGRLAPGWRLRCPLEIRIETEEDGTYIASDDVFAVYGNGESRQKAIEDYKLSLIDYYQLLADRAREDAPTLELFRRLQGYMEAVD